ncbi:hypothetical protein Tco_1247881 [Tanacetum coccineum]
MQDSPAYKTYIPFPTGAVTPKKARKFKKPTFPSKKKTLVLLKNLQRNLPRNLLLEDSMLGFKFETLLVCLSQLKKAIKRSKREIHIHQAGGSSERADLELEVPDEPKGKTIDIRDSDDDDQQSDDERTEFNNDDKVVDINKTDDEEDDEFVHTPNDYVPIDDEKFERINKEMYSDVNVELKDSEHESEWKDDEEMTDAGQVDAENEEASQEVADGLKRSPHTPTTIEATTSTTIATDSTTLIAIHQKLFDVENEVKTLRNINHSSAIRAAVKSEVLIIVKEYLRTSLDDALHKHKALNHALMESILKDKDAMDKGVADKLKKRKPDDDKDEGPSARPDQWHHQDLGEDTGNTDEPPVVNVDPKDWFKKPERPPTPDPKWNEGKSVENKPTQKWICDLPKAEKPSKTFNDLMSTPIDFNAFVMNRLQISDLTQDILVGPTYKILKGTCKSFIELEYNMEECYKAMTDQLDWNNPKGNRYPFNLSKPLPLVKSGNHQIVPVDYFFNNDLAYLQEGNTNKAYTTSLTKTKAAKYDLLGIEDMVPNLWSPIKVAYDKHALLGTSHWGPKRQRFYGYAFKRVSKHDVYSTKIILAVTNLKVNVWYGYGHIEEIKVRRSDQKMYKFIEGNFLRLHLNDIEDMLLLVKIVEDLKLGVESYQKKLNISKPRTREEDLSRRAPYTTLSDPQGVIYKDKLVDKI